MGTIYGTTGNDNLTSTSPSGDTIVAYEGNDTLNGGVGPDVLLGNQGNDVIVAGAGADTVYGGTGADIIYGNQDNDVIYGNEDNDNIAAGLGNDYVEGGTGNDSIQGNEGADTLIGGDGADIMYGNQDNDLLLGNTGNDIISGGNNEDTIYGGQGDDQLYGNDGNDVIYANEGRDYIEGGTGYDIAKFSGNYGEFAFGKNAAGQLVITDTNSANGNEGITVLNADVETIDFNGTLVSNPGLVSTLPSAGKNIYVAGDSVSEGYGLSVGDRWTTKLDALQAGTVHNGARSGATATVYRGNPNFPNNIGIGELWDGTAPNLPNGSVGQAHLQDATGPGSAPAGMQTPIDAFIGGGHQAAGDTAIISAGRNDITKDDMGAGGTYSQAAVLAEIANMVADVGNRHFLVQSVLLTSYEGASSTGDNLTNRNQVLSLNAALSSIYGSAYVDTNQALMNVAQNDGTIDGSLFLPPPDGIHPNATGSTVIANFLSGEISARGW